MSNFEKAGPLGPAQSDRAASAFFVDRAINRVAVA